jgi:hypothetical protein
MRLIEGAQVSHSQFLYAYLVTCSWFHSVLAAQLSVTSSASMKATRTFISTAYIGRHHDGVEREKNHVILQPVQYHNYITNGSAALPLCGLVVQDVISRVDMLLDHVTKQGQIWVSRIESHFNTDAKILPGDSWNSLSEGLYRYDVSTGETPFRK